MRKYMADRTASCWKLISVIKFDLRMANDSELLFEERRSYLASARRLVAELKTLIYGGKKPAYFEDNSKAAGLLHAEFVQLNTAVTEF